MDIEKLIEKLNDFNENHIAVLCGSGQCACGYLCDKDDCIVVRAATALSTLQAENEQLRAYLEYEREHADAYYEECGQWETENEKLRAELDDLRIQWDMYGGDVGITATYAELERVKAERDAAVKAVKNMAEYIVCAGRVDYYLCDEISQEHHLKYQPKNDGNYDNEPCYKCIADWFLQGHVWQENC